MRRWSVASRVALCSAPALWGRFGARLAPGGTGLPASRDSDAAPALRLPP
jgi:hypothetical protein